MFDVEKSWKMSEPEMVLALIKEVQVWRLGNLDGCCCCSFSVRNVSVEIGCGKGGERGVWVSSGSLDYWDGISEDSSDERLLRPVAEEVARQIEESDGRGPLPLHFFGRNAKDKSQTIDGELAAPQLPAAGQA